jgi:hypothetical protein
LATSSILQVVDHSHDQSGERYFTSIYEYLSLHFTPKDLVGRGRFIDGVVPTNEIVVFLIARVVTFGESKEWSGTDTHDNEWVTQQELVLLQQRVVGWRRR